MQPGHTREGLQELCGRLVALSKGTATLPQSFMALTSAVVDKVNEHPPSAAQFILMEWFRCYCAHMDEVLVLVKGELVRKYHRAEHEKYIRSRGHEDSYYSGGKYQLSAASLDGFNYEIRAGGFEGKTWVERLSDSMEEEGKKLEQRAKAIEACEVTLASALKRAYGASIKVTSKMGRSLHKGEWFKVSFPPEARVAEIHLTRNALVADASRFHNRAASLSTEVRVPASLQHVDPRALERQRDEANKALRAADEARRERERQAADVPLDEIKRAFNANKLTTTYVSAGPVELDEDEDEDGGEGGVDNFNGKGAGEAAIGCRGSTSLVRR